MALKPFNILDAYKKEKEGMLKNSKTPTPNILSGSPVSNVKPQTLLTLKQPLPTGTREKLENIKTALPQKTQPPQTIPLQPPVMSDEQKIQIIQKMTQQGATPDVIQRYLDSLKSPIAQPQPEMSLNERINKGGADFTAKVISGAITGTGNIIQGGQNIVGRGLNYASNVILPKRFEQEYKPQTFVGDTTKSIAQGFENLQGRVSSQGPINQESWQAKLGEVVGESIPAMYAGGVAGRIFGASSKLLPAIARGATEGYAFDLASGSETPGVSTVVGAGIPVVGKVVSLFTQALPKGLIARGMATPSAIKNASERLSRLSDNGVLDIDKAPQWMLDKGLKGSKKQVQEQLRNIITESGKQKSSMLASYAGPVDTKIVDSLRGALKEVLPNYAKVGKNIIPKAGNDDIVREILGFINKKNPTLQEVERARTLLGNMNIFTKSGEMADTAAKEGLQNIWVQTSKYLDETIPGFRNTNKDIEVAYALSKAIGLKEAQDSARQLITMTDLMSGGISGLYGYTQTGDWKKALAYGAVGLGAKSLLNNPQITTRTAQTLSKGAKFGKTKTGTALKNVIKGATLGTSQYE